MFLFRSTKPAPIDSAKQQEQEPKAYQPSVLSPAEGMADRPRIRSSESTGSLPHVADMLKSGRKVSGMRAAFERSSNKRSSPDLPGSSRSSERGGRQGRQDPVPEQKMLKHDADIAHLTEELEKERISRKEGEAKSARLEQEVERLKAELNQKDTFWREEMRKKLHEARQEGSLGVPAKEMHSARGRPRLGVGDTGLQRQLTDLKRSISKSTRVETVITSDATFAQEMGSLAHEVQNWTVNNYRRAKISASAEELVARLEPVVNDRQLERLRPVWAAWRSENKIAVFQSTVACMLMDIFDDQLLFGLPPQEEWAMSLRKTANHMSAVLEPQQFNKWRASTLDIIRQTAVMSAAADSAAATMAEYVASTLDVIIGMPSSGGKLASLQPVVRRAITLAHLFRIQRARFSFDLPPPMVPFDPKTMENIAFDRDAEEGNPVDCATFPLVLKLGDEHGANVLQWQNVLQKANVVCGDT